MYRRLVAGVKLAFGLHRPGRNLDVFPDDVFIVSYPKSGNTWTRFLIANLIYPEKAPDFRNINELIPDPEALSKRHLAKLPRPRIVKTHQYFHPCYRKIIFIVRDPRDVAVSLYYFQRKCRVYPDGYPIDEHVRGLIYNVSPPYGTWGENVASWLAARGSDPDFLLLRYEDMLKDPGAELRKIAEFLRIEAVQDRIALAVDRSSADNMRKLERSQAHLWSSTKETRQDIPFVRTANSGNWQSELSRTSVVQIERAWGGIMRQLGYTLLYLEELGIDGNEILPNLRLPASGEEGKRDMAKVR